MDVVNEAGQQRRCEGWSYVINPPGSEIQVIVQMEPVGHHGTHDLPEVDISSLHPSDSLPKVAAQWWAMPSLTEVGGSVMLGAAKLSLPTNPSRMPGKKLALRG